MKDYKFYDRRHISAYLGGSMILYKNKPVWVYAETDLRGDTILIGTYPNTEPRPREVDWTPLYENKDISLDPFPMGFVHLKDHKDSHSVVYVSRMPVRMWKIGLHPNNTVIQMFKDSPIKYTINEILTSISFRNCVTNQYIKISDLELILKEKNKNIVAVSRKIAIDNKANVYRHPIPVPVGSFKDGYIVLKNNFSYLREAILEEGFDCK